MRPHPSDVDLAVPCLDWGGTSMAGTVFGGDPTLVEYATTSSGRRFEMTTEEETAED